MAIEWEVYDEWSPRRILELKTAVLQLSGGGQDRNLAAVMARVLPILERNHARLYSVHVHSQLGPFATPAHRIALFELARSLEDVLYRTFSARGADGRMHRGVGTNYRSLGPLTDAGVLALRDELGGDPLLRDALSDKRIAGFLTRVNGKQCWLNLGAQQLGTPLVEMRVFDGPRMTGDGAADAQPFGDFAVVLRSLISATDAMVRTGARPDPAPLGSHFGQERRTDGDELTRLLALLPDDAALHTRLEQAFGVSGLPRSDGAGSARQGRWQPPPGTGTRAVDDGQGTRLRQLRLASRRTPDPEEVGKLFTGQAVKLDGCDLADTKVAEDRSHVRLGSDRSVVLPAVDRDGVFGLEGASMIGVDARNVSMTRMRWLRVEAHDIMLTGAHLNGNEFSRCNFNRGQLSRADLSDAELDDVDFINADLTDVTMQGAQLDRCNLRGANLRGGHLARAHIRGCSGLRDANLAEVDLSGAVLDRVDLSDGILPRANLRGAELHHVDFTRACLVGADLRDVVVGAGCTFDGADLRGAQLGDLASKVDLSTAVLDDGALSRLPTEGPKPAPQLDPDITR